MPAEVRSRIEQVRHASTGVQGIGHRVLRAGWVPAQLPAEAVAAALETPCGRLWKSESARCLAASGRHFDD